MSAAAAMAGSLISVQLVYVGTNDYLVDFRKTAGYTRTGEKERPDGNF